MKVVKASDSDLEKKIYLELKSEVVAEVTAKKKNCMTKVNYCLKYIQTEQISGCFTKTLNLFLHE